MTALPTILVVDDERDIVIALEDLLGDDYRVLSTTSPHDALEILKREPDIAAIVSDQRMPEMTGDRFLAAARAHTDAEALLLTGYADLEAVVAAINTGRIVGYANKPWEAGGLRAMVAGAVERWTLKRALAFEQAMYAALVDGGADVVTAFDEQGITVRGDRIADAADIGALAAGTPTDEEERRTDPQGAPKWLRVQRIPFTAVGGRPHLLRIESDSTARRLLEQRLLQSEKLQALGTLAGGIAHDFNNLLTAVLGNLELAERRAGDDPRLARFIANASDAARRGTALTQRLLSFSRQRDLAATAIDPNVLVLGVRDLIVRTLGGSVVLDFNLADGIWAARADVDQLELAILNLCINARDAMPEGGRITVATGNVTLADTDIEARPPGDYVCISVHDSGSGMPPDVVARVFEPFFTTKEPGRGTGLGLPMVHAMARGAGGDVAVESWIGEGTKVTIWLPRTLDPVADPSDAAIDRPAASAPLRILVSEDDAEVRAVTLAYLDELGHAHVAVPSGDAALALLRTDSDFDLLVTDFAMPGMSGLDLANAVAELLPALPVILVTGFADDGRFPPQVSLLPKPFTQSDLAHALAAVVARDG